jgi:uncharacterized membrane protein YuzA (DUF378 family)
MASHGTTMHMFLMALVLIGALNWGLGLFNINAVESIHNGINSLAKSKLPINKVIYGTVAVAALYLAMQRDTWLPFLGRTVMPVQLLVKGEPAQATKIITVHVKPHQHVVFWAALPKGEDAAVDTAYGDYSNSGLTVADENGKAKLHVIEGTGYVLPSGTHLKRHVHYRVAGLEYGMMGPIRTVFY